MPNKLPKAVRDAMARLNFVPPDKEVQDELTRTYFAGMRAGLLLSWNAPDEATILTLKAEIRRMEKEAECK